MSRCVHETKEPCRKKQLMSNEESGVAPRRGRPRKNPISSEQAPVKQTSSKDFPKSAAPKQATIEHVKPIENPVESPVEDTREEAIDVSGAEDLFGLSIVFAPEIVAEPVLTQSPSPAARPDLFLIYKDRSILGVVEEGSAAHLSIEAHIASEIRQWIEEARAPLDDRGLLWLNIGKHARNYKSWSAYFAQNGLAPRQPQYLTKMDFWRSQMDANATDEEVVARYAGRNSTYHAVPIRLLEDTV